MQRLFSVLLGFLCLGATAFAQDASVSSEDAPPSIVGLQWVAPNADGVIPGSVVFAGAKQASFAGDIFLVDKEGGLQRFPVAEDGSFQLNGLGGGVYTIAYRGAGGFAVLALQVVEGAGADVTHQAVIPASHLNPQQAMTTIARYQPIRVPAPKTIAGGVPVQMVTSADEALKVSRSAEGSLTGKLIQAGTVGSEVAAANGMNIFLLQDGKVVGNAVTNYDGRFEITDLELGYYDLVTSGPHGYAAIGFELVSADQAVAGMTSTNGESFVSTPVAVHPPPAITIVLVPAPPGPGFSAVNAATGDDGGPVPPLPPGAGPLPPGPPVAGGGFGGGGFAGGGGGGGLGGGGGIGGLAAIGGVIAAVLATNDDNNNRIPYIPPPVSPATP